MGDYDDTADDFEPGDYEERAADVESPEWDSGHEPSRSEEDEEGIEDWIRDIGYVDQYFQDQGFDKRTPYSPPPVRYPSDAWVWPKLEKDGGKASWHHSISRITSVSSGCRRPSRSTWMAGETRTIIPEIDLTMVWCPPGRLTLVGEPTPSTWGCRSQPLDIARGFWISRVPITLGQWSWIAKAWGAQRGPFAGDFSDFPMVGVTWFHALRYCSELTLRTKSFSSGWIFTLPTDSQWEYACRAGSTSLYCFGDDASRLDEFAWSRNESESARSSSSKLQPVAKKSPNNWGVYDMHGNIWEWCRLDESGPDGQITVSKPGPVTTMKLMPVRGGSYGSQPDRVTSSSRDLEDPSLMVDCVGFRVALVPYG